jgi:glycosyltransferase involved in cell wall biosynthesis
LRILILHSRYLSGDASGENRVVEDECRLLQEGGHDVRLWQPSPTEVHGVGLLRTSARAIWSRSAAQQVVDLVREHRSDVVHIHNLTPALSPAVIRGVAAEGIPVVVTLHNYRYMCLPATFLRDDRICEDCLGHIPWRGVYHRCYRGSALASGVMATAFTLHGKLGTFGKVAKFLAVSSFVKEKYIEAGFSPESIAIKSNFVWPAEVRDGGGDYFLFAGRLSPEKGIETLVKAWDESLGHLVIVGDGPQGPMLRASAPKGVEFRGFVPGEQIPELLRGARALLFPSICYEAQPRIILEAYAVGVPVIASEIGGISELVSDGATGFLVPPEDVGEWFRTIGRLRDDELATRMGVNALKLWQARYSPEKGLHDLEEAYESAFQMHGN